MKGFTKKEVLEMIDEVLNTTAPGNKIYHRTDKDTKKLTRALKKIPKFNEAILKSDYYKVERRKSKKGKSYKCLVIVQWNGRKVAVTKTAIKEVGKEWNKRSAVLAELRTLAEDDIKRFRERNVPRWARAEGLHIDHITPFIQLACEWVMSEGYKSFEELPGRKYYKRFLLDKNLQESWQQYHKENAKLKAVSAKVNLRESAKGYEAPF